MRTKRTKLPNLGIFSWEVFLKEEVAIVVGGGGVMCEGQVPSSTGRRLRGLHSVQCTLLLRSCNYVEAHDDDIIQTSCHEKCKYMILSSSFTNPKTFWLGHEKSTVVAMVTNISYGVNYCS